MLCDLLFSLDIFFLNHFSTFHSFHKSSYIFCSFDWSCYSGIGLGVLFVIVCGCIEMGGNCFTKIFRKICLQGATLNIIFFQRISSVKELFKGKRIEKVNDSLILFYLDCSCWVISIVLSASSPILSCVLSILLFKSSTEFLILCLLQFYNFWIVLYVSYFCAEIFHCFVDICSLILWRLC